MVEFSAFAPTDETPPVDQIPTILGSGFLSTIGEVATRLLPRDGVEVTSDPAIASSADLVESRSAYARAVSWSARAKFGLGGGAAEARARSVKTFRTSQYKLVLALNKYVENKTYTLPEATFPDAAATLYNSNPGTFLQRYGDEYVKAVKTGGILTILYHLTFNTREERSQFSASGNWRSLAGSGASAGASYHESVARSASNATISLESFCTGVKDAPALFGRDRHASSVIFDSADARALITYFDEFEEAVFRTDAAGLLVVDTEAMFRLPGAPESMAGLASSMRSRVQTITRAEALDDEIDRRMSETSYFLEKAYAWNPGKPTKPATELLAKLKTLDGQLSEAVSGIAQLDTDNFVLPFSAADLPEVPEDWKLTPFARRARRPIFSSKGENFFELELDIGEYKVGQPARVEFATKFIEEDRDDRPLERAGWSISIKNTEGQPIETIYQEDLPNWDAVYRSILKPRAADPHPIQYTFALPAGASKVVFTCSKRALILAKGHFELLL